MTANKVASLVKGRKITALLLLIGALVGYGIVEWNKNVATPTSSASPAPADPTPLATTEFADLISRLTIVAEPRDRADYDRDCGSGDGCQFGARWSDDTAAPGAHNGCDTRNDILNLQLTDVTHKSGTNDCVVLTGILIDPYTGQSIHFSKAQASKVQIDHVYPLARAWKFGAYGWTQSQRETFANDVESNLLAVDGSANQAKGARGPSQWMPPAAAGRCEYATKYLTVAVKYQLAVTEADRAVAVAACS